MLRFSRHSPREGPALHPLPRAHRLITRGRVAAWHDGWGAVTAEISPQDYLTRRLRDYLSTTPPPWEPLPYVVAIDGGNVVVTPNPEVNTPPGQRLREEPTDEDPLVAVIDQSPWLSSLERQLLLRELQQLMAAEAKITGPLSQVDENLTDRKAAQLDEIADGQVPLVPLARPPGRRGRPRQSFPWGPVLGSLVIVLTVLIEAWQFALPYLNATGVDVTNLAAEWRRNPVGVLAGSGFALATATALFAGWYWVISAAAALSRRVGLEPWWTTAARAIAPLGVSALLLAATIGIGAMRHTISQGTENLTRAVQGQALASDGSVGVFVLLTLIVPLAVAYLQHQLQAAWARGRPGREQRAQEALHAWRERERRAEPIRRLEKERADLARQLAKVQAQYQVLIDYAQASEQRFRETVDAKHQSSRAYVHSLVAALERDRFYYVWAATKKRGAEALGYV